MTAYLQPGDRIHLALPTSSGHREDAIADLRRQISEIEPAYATQGVTVISWSGHSQLQVPTVVAVFRKPKEQ